MREDDKSSGSSRNAQGPGKPDWWDVNSMNLGCAAIPAGFIGVPPGQTRTGILLCYGT